MGDDISYFIKKKERKGDEDYYISTESLIIINKLKKNINFKTLYLSKTDGINILIGDNYMLIFVSAFLDVDTISEIDII